MALSASGFEMFNEMSDKLDETSRDGSIGQNASAQATSCQSVKKVVFYGNPSFINVFTKPL
jgi:hypothetical protein